MTLNAESLSTLLCERLCEDVVLEERSNGELMLRTHFEFPDGDVYPIYLSESQSGGIKLSDRGHTLMHMSYEHEIDNYMDGTRGMLLERIMAENDLEWDGGAFSLATAPDKLPLAIFQFGQALTRIYDLTLLSRSNVGSTFYDDLAELISRWVDESKFERDYIPNVPNAQAYIVDYKIDGSNDVPLFIYGIPNRDKARLATIMLSHFHRSQFRFESILIFENQQEIPRADLARLSDVGGDMISSLESADDFQRKLVQRVAA